MEKNSSILYRALALLTMGIWSITFVCTKVLLVYYSPIDLLLLRMVFALLFSLLYEPKVKFKIGLRGEWYCFLAALFGIGVYQVAENYALVYSSASQVSVIVSTAPLLTVIIAFLFKCAKKLTPAFFIGFLFALSGIAIISFKDGVGHFSALGTIFAFVSALSWALYSFAFKKASSLGLSNKTITQRMFFYTFLFLIPFALFDGSALTLTPLKKPEVLFNLLFLSLFASATAFLLWAIALKGLGAIEANIYIYAIPFLTAIFGAIFLKESITLVSLCGLVLVVIGLCLSDDSIRGSIKGLIKRAK